MAIDLKEHWPVLAAGALVVGGAVWASRARAQQAVETTVVQPQPVDVGSIVAAQASIAQSRLQAGTQLGMGLLSAFQRREELAVERELSLAQIASQQAIAQAQIAAELQSAQLAAQVQSQMIEAQTQAQLAQLALQERIAQMQADIQLKALEAELERRRAELQAQLEAQRAQAAAQQQQAFWGFLGMLLPLIFLSRERTQAAAAVRAYTSGGLRAQLRVTRELLGAVA